MFGDRNYKGGVVAFDKKYKCYKIKYEDDDVEEMNETEVGHHLVSNPNAPLPQPQQPPRVAKSSTCDAATTKSRRSRRSNAPPRSSVSSNYYNPLAAVDEPNGDDDDIIMTTMQPS